MIPDTGQVRYTEVYESHRLTAQERRTLHFKQGHIRVAIWNRMENQGQTHKRVGVP